MSANEWRLYEIDQLLNDAIIAASEKIGDDGAIPEDWAEFLDHVQLERDSKALNVAMYIKSIDAEAEAVKAEKMKLAARQSALENKAEALRNYLQANLQHGEKLSNARVLISWRKSDRLVVDDQSKLPQEFVEMVPKIDNAGIKAAIKAGNEIAGAHIESRNNIQIR